jgi:FeoC like transcriptional regulator
MILALKAYIAQHKLVNTVKLCEVFAVTAEALEPMLQHWVQKGLLKPYEPCKNCHQLCHGCPSATPAWFLWHESV